MMKSGVTSGATGENAVVYNSKRADVIVGPVGIVMADAMLGEITPTMAAAVASNDAKLILIPMSKCHATIVGVESRRLGEYIVEAVDEIAENCFLRVLPTGMRIIAIDGRCAAGKTTLAARLAKELGGDVIHMDDFFLPPALRTQERRSEPGGNVHYERFLTEVIPKLASGQAFSYQRFDCSRMAPGDWLPVQNNGFVFVEGAYSCHPVLGEYMDRKVFLDIDHETQTERIRTRNGEDILQDFLQLWIPLEEAYFQAFSLEENTDYIIKQTKGETDAASVLPGL